MNYLVMETHPAYAVVLDEGGRFLKAANLRYQVGDTVQEIVELRTPQKKPVPLWKPLSGLVGLAACFCLVFFGYYQPNFIPYGALRIQINPDVELTLSRTDRVLELEGLNEDGQDLINGYNYSGKDREDVAGELVERAIHMGYLSGGETVAITATSSDAGWQAREELEARDDLEERYGDTIVIQIGSMSQELPQTGGGDPGDAAHAGDHAGIYTGAYAGASSESDRSTNCSGGYRLWPRLRRSDRLHRHRLWPQQRRGH